MKNQRIKNIFTVLKLKEPKFMNRHSSNFWLLYRNIKENSTILKKQCPIKK